MFYKLFLKIHISSIFSLPKLKIVQKGLASLKGCVKVTDNCEHWPQFSSKSGQTCTVALMANVTQSNMVNSVTPLAIFEKIAILWLLFWIFLAILALFLVMLSHICISFGTFLSCITYRPWDPI